MQILGIDVGGTGIKGAVIETATGELASERLRIASPHPATPESVGATLRALVEQHRWSGSIGIGFAAAIQRGVARTTANIDPSFIGWPVTESPRRDEHVVEKHIPDAFIRSALER
ncbi:MAG: ROK family protein [Candidatus Competibacteraceae bacterium]|mgnify:CR=1 FL=1|nr:ROK family protein [Candidatus Competibacteraceae bacterium]MBK8896413.1 ROK family protein [Candidatus Competibacteraceae bacterium]MBK8964168.1 ROK family protein [Candidatus Competibacteraceae bacterium]MBK9952715.1 ROK family protein [Candidatus Competibacteraceae bacterium]